MTRNEDALNVAIRQAFVEAAARAWDDAGLAGLCAEGRWEAALQALRSVDVAPLLASRLRSQAGEAEPGP